MSFKDLEEKNAKPQQRVETPEEQELRARAAARHRAKEESKAAKHGGARREAPSTGGAARGDPKDR